MFFEKKINQCNKEDLVAFLAGHYRYQTGSTWSGGSSYAHCVKLNHLGLSGQSLEKAFEVTSTDDDYWRHLGQPIREFEAAWYGGYTILNNGRSGGYLVLSEAEVHNPGYKSTCTRCGQLNYQEAFKGAVCGVCKAPRVNLKRPLSWVRPRGLTIDHRMSKEDYLDMGHSWLKDRAELVRAFDAACDGVRDAFIDLLDDFMVIEETVMVPHKVRRLEPVWE